MLAGGARAFKPVLGNLSAGGVWSRQEAVFRDGRTAEEASRRDDRIACDGTRHLEVGHAAGGGLVVEVSDTRTSLGWKRGGARLKPRSLDPVRGDGTAPELAIDEWEASHSSVRASKPRDAVKVRSFDGSEMCLPHHTTSHRRFELV